MTSTEFIHTLPEKVDTAVLEGVDTNFHFDISGEGGGERTVIVKDGEVKVYDHFEGEPKCVVKTSNDNFMKLLRGQLNPMMAVLTGKVKISNQSEMLKYAKLFGLM